MPQPPKVLVLRAATQSSALADHLRALGLDPILLPAIELAPPTTFAPLDHALANLPHFHWLLLTSANAVHAAAARLAPQPLQFPGQIAAIGPATAAALTAHGLTAHLIPPQAVAESLTAALLPHARQPDNTPTRFLLLRAEEARDHLPATLTAAGAEVTVAPAYRNLLPTASAALLRTLFSPTQPPPAAITFTSSSTARNLLALCQAANVTLPPTTLRISIGPITTQTLHDLHLLPHAESPQATIESLAQTTLQALNTALTPKASS